MSLSGEMRESRSGIYGGGVYLYAPAYVKTPAWATHERLDLRCDEVVIADCCLCKMRADETICEIFTGQPHPKGLDWDAMDDEERSNWLWGYYYEPHTKISCAEGFGCTVKRRRRSSRHLREGMYEYAD
jgi:hypothetical protein